MCVGVCVFMCKEEGAANDKFCDEDVQPQYKYLRERGERANTSVRQCRRGEDANEPAAERSSRERNGQKTHSRVGTGEVIGALMRHRSEGLLY